jgi:release factor glutamine methyltransferase
MKTWTISEILDWATDFFRKQKMEWPHLEAEILLAHTLNVRRIELYINYKKVLEEEELTRFKEMIQRRSRREPLAYITGVQPFMSIDFFVNPSVLIPRPETEKLVEIAIDIIKLSRSRRIVDIGTGNGAIALSLAKYYPNIQVIGIDASPAAIAIAQKNAEHHNLSQRAQFIAGDMFKPLKEKVDIIVSNPPYIPTKEIQKLDTSVKEWEPREALDGGKDGLKYIRELINTAPNYLPPRGHLLIEIGFDQGPQTKSLAENMGRYKEVKILKDINGNDRLLKATTTA